ncbi:MAG: T9SS type A sorting domain-containing protein [Bacteroidota bacterium]|nr:T9SS type A sorting domain-containing protein [Bacteroidota bacterium]
MKKLISLFVVAFLCATATFADDAAVVANWQFPVVYWFPQGNTIPAEGIDNYPRAQALADSIGDFDAPGAVFDEVWNGLSRQGVSGAGYPIAKILGNLPSDHGAADFSGAFKVVYDQNNIYVLLKYHDDDITGGESVEIMWAPYLSIPEISSIASVIADKTDIKQQAAYARYAQFGADKAAFTSKGFRDAMMIDFDATGKGNISWTGTNAILSSSLSYDDKTEQGSNDVKAIYTIGYQALTGNAYSGALNARPDFNTLIWRALNGGKGISFDIHIIDKDGNDAKNTATTPVPTPAEYWWNSTSNDGYAETYYSGFLGVNTTLTALKSVYSNKSVIFGNVTATQVELTKNANVEVFNAVGKRVLTLKNINKIDLTDLNKGVYLIRANNETLKFAR